MDYSTSPDSFPNLTVTEKPMTPVMVPKPTPPVAVPVETMEPPKEMPIETQVTKEPERDVARPKTVPPPVEKQVVKEPVVPKITIEMKKFAPSKKFTQYSTLISFNLIFALLYIFKVRLMAIFCNLLIVGVAIGGILSSMNPNRRKADEVNVNLVFINQAVVSDVAIVVATKLNHYISYFRRIVLWQDFVVSVKFTVCLYVLGIFFKYVPLPLLIYLACWVYYLYMYMCKELADKVLVVVVAKFNKVMGRFDNACQKVPKMKDVGKEL